MDQQNHNALIEQDEVPTEVEPGGDALPQLPQQLPGEAPWEWPVPRPNRKGEPTPFPDQHFIENAQYLLDRLGVSPRYNQMTRDIEFSGLTYGSVNEAWLDVLNMGYRWGLAKEPLADFIKDIAYKQAYHPVREFIEQKPWDGVDRLEDLLATVEAQPDYPEDLKRTLLLTWMISGVKAIYSPQGLAAQGVLVFQGNQGMRKTRWLGSVTPPGSSQEGLSLSLSGGASVKDSIDKATTRTFGELGELESTYARQMPQLKAFVTAAVDRFRPSYGRVTEDFPRRTIFLATVNDSHFLSDDTGNRRWWTIPVVRCHPEHGIDIQQLWAQLACIYVAMGGVDAPHWLDDAEQAQLDAVNRKFEPEDPMESDVVDRVTFHDTDGTEGKRLRASEVWRELYDIPVRRRPEKGDAAAVAKMGRILTRRCKAAGYTPASANGTSHYRVTIAPPPGDENSVSPKTAAAAERWRTRPTTSAASPRRLNAVSPSDADDARKTLSAAG